MLADGPHPSINVVNMIYLVILVLFVECPVSYFVPPYEFKARRIYNATWADWNVLCIVPLLDARGLALMDKVERL
jgi:hypothetical protein